MKGDVIEDVALVMDRQDTVATRSRISTPGGPSRTTGGR